MLSVIICEDNPQQLRNLEKIINDVIIIENLDMEIKFKTNNPDEILQYLKSNKNTVGLYFLDVDLQHEMTGIELASKIREYDDYSKIVFVTTHSEMSYLTFTYKIEALDYIIKDQLDSLADRVRDCILTAEKRYRNDNSNHIKKYVVKLGEKFRSFDYSDIMFFESSITPHKIILHLDNSQFEFYGSIKDIENVDECLYRCHKSYVVNKDNISSIDKKSRVIIMANGEPCYASIRAIGGLFDE